MHGQHGDRDSTVQSSYARMHTYWHVPDGNSSRIFTNCSLQDSSRVTIETLNPNSPNQTLASVGTLPSLLRILRAIRRQIWFHSRALASGRVERRHAQRSRLRWRHLRALRHRNVSRGLELKRNPVAPVDQNRHELQNIALIPAE